MKKYSFQKRTPEQLLRTDKNTLNEWDRQRSLWADSSGIDESPTKNAGLRWALFMAKMATLRILREREQQIYPPRFLQNLQNMLQNLDPSLVPSCWPTASTMLRRSLAASQLALPQSLELSQPDRTMSLSHLSPKRCQKSDQT